MKKIERAEQLTCDNNTSLKEKRRCRGCYELFTPDRANLIYCSRECHKLVDWEWREARLLDTGATDDVLEKHRRYHPRYRSKQKLNESDMYEMKTYMDTMAELRDDRLKESRRGNIDLGKLIERDNSICYLCGEKVGKRKRRVKGKPFYMEWDYPTVDHIIPLSRDGSHTWDNVKLAHWRCNKRKAGSLRTST